MPDYSLVPWKSPDGKPMRDRRRDAEHPLDRPRLLAGPQRLAPSTTSPTRPTRGRSASRSSPRQRPLLSAVSPPRASTRRRAPIRPPTSSAGETSSTRASPTAPTRRTIIDELTQHHSSYYIDDSDHAGADADVERVHRRPLPGRRDDPLLQPDDGPSTRMRIWRSSSATSATRGPRTRPTSPARSSDRAGRWIDHYIKGAGAKPRSRASRRSPRPARRSAAPADRTRRRAGRRSRPARSASSDSATKTIAADSSDRRRLQPDQRRRLRDDALRRHARSRRVRVRRRSRPAATR